MAKMLDFAFDPRKVPFDFLMKAIGEQGHSVLVRFDPLRDKNKFTIVIDNIRIGDTDSPKSLLIKIIDYTERTS